MSVTLKPLGVTCNIQCQYCYQNALRDAAGGQPAYDIEKMKRAVVENGGPFVLFGGEALLLPLRDLEALWSFGLAHYGHNSVQTNGALITDEHIRLFKAYKVAVGISLDGPDELNDVRWAGTLKRTREATARTDASIRRLCEAGVPPGMIVTLHRGNATAEKLPRMHAWFRELERLGVRSVRLHVLEVEDDRIKSKYGLSADENVAALLSLLQLERSGLEALRFDMFRDMRNLLLGRDEKSSCVWNACDPYTTKAVRGITGDGQISNCDRTNNEGIDFAKSSSEGFERYLALYRTPQPDGGCNGCRFFLMCKGQCPGTAIGGDWRNRTEYCEVWKRVYAHLEDHLVDEGEAPVSLDSRREEIERLFLRAWQSGTNTNIARCLDRLARRQGSTAPHEAGSADLPDFTRVVWVDDRARETWEPRLRRIAMAWDEIEWLSVLKQVRRCALVTVSAEVLLERTNAWARHGLAALPLEIQHRGDLAHDATSRAAGPEPRPAWRTVMGRPEDVWSFRRSLDLNDADAMAALTGCPRCCADRVKELWGHEDLIDATWAIATAGLTAAEGDGIVAVDGPYQCNSLLRWIGIRATPHLPCSFGCTPSAELADRLMSIGRQAGYGAEMAWMKDALSWPVEWSALHGIAEIRTPILKIATRADWTAARRAVKYPGTCYPDEGATGLRFPYRRARGRPFTASKAFARGLRHDLGPATGRSPGMSAPTMKP